MKQDIPHRIVIIAKFHSPTNSRGSRFSLTLPRWDGKRIYCSWSYDKNNLPDQAQAFFSEKEIPVESFGELANEYVFMVSFDHAEKVLALFGLQKAA